MKQSVNSRPYRSREQRARQQQAILLAALFAVFLLFGCGVVSIMVAQRIVGSLFDSGSSTTPVQPGPVWDAESAELSIAVSPMMAPVLDEIAQEFNQQGQETPDGRAMTVQVFALTPDKMVKEALAAPAFQAISPDSSLWLEELEQAWSAQQSTSDENTHADSAIPIGQTRTSNRVRYAVSPIVIAAWEEVARKLGWPDNPVGWQDIQQLATRDPDFKWNHASTNTASGLLATLAEFYAGAGLTRSLTEEAARAPETLAYVQAVESTVRFYGEGEEVIVQRLMAEGRNFLDAFVAQEHTVIDWNRTRAGDRLVAIYPAEGTLWTDHPLALLELGTRAGEASVTVNQRLTFRAFADYLTSASIQQTLLRRGYRPADLSLPLDGPESPFASGASDSEVVDWRQPQTTLQMPSPAVIDVVRNAWYLTKRPTNVYLVVDTSGSMEGIKLTRAKEALRAFVSQIQGSRDRVGIVDFGSGTKTFTPLRILDDQSRVDTMQQVDTLEAYGGTALIDAVHDATVDLLAQGDSEAINAVVVMTDGQENESQRSLSDLQNLTRGNVTTLVVFTIAFGNDADEQLLRDIATIGHGQFRRADETDIEELYRTISTYF